MTFSNSATITILVVTAMAAGLVHAQKQTPANVPQPTWTDSTAGLMWAREDNGSDIQQPQALAYCRDLRLAGFRDWRLPEIGELEQIYDPSVVSGTWSFDSHRYDLHVKGSIRMTGCCGWSATSGKSTGEAWAFGFDGGLRVSVGTGDSDSARVLCVRRAEN